MDTLSLTGAKELFEEFPAWKGLARTEIGADEKPYLVIEVSAPKEANVEQGLIITTANDEITVGFDFYHSHFGSWKGDGSHVGTLAALEFIKQIVTERVAVMSWWSGEKWQGSEQWEAGEKIEVPSWAKSKNVDLARLRSWKGSLNADVAV